ncbi:MAG: hypothetical protein ONB46_11670 [candidate division KSB1 bacterium]|nr:hypothetical protein [candidate division KSB1 bacterium]MDZ7366653.1 hypothetical protein [candidate division KSB1 bacterium]
MKATKFCTENIMFKSSTALAIKKMFPTWHLEPIRKPKMNDSKTQDKRSVQTFADFF